MTGTDDSDEVGNLGEEAAKLLHALQAWAREGGGDLSDAAAEAATGAAGAMQGFTEHIATGAPECKFCPLCQVISAVRGTSPEVRQHLTSAASSLMQALAGAMATDIPDQTRKKRSDSGVEKITLDGEEGD